MLKIIKSELEFRDMIKIVYISEEEVHFSDGTILSSDHDADCCEINFADFNSLKDTALIDKEFDVLSFEKTEFGFLLNGHLVNCYSFQNGYYSDEVDIYVSIPSREKRILVLSTHGKEDE